MDTLGKIVKRWRRRRKRTQELRDVLDIEATRSEGFHGDRYVLELADFFLGRSEAFVETGALGGTTALYVGRQYGVPVFSCESDPVSYAFAAARCKDLANVHVTKQRSPKFLHRLFKRHPELSEKRLTFWLDAHGYGFKWPLADEVRFITRTVKSAFVMIDDFKVPGRPEFGYDEYDGQVCGLEHVGPALAPREYHLILPAYSERTGPVDGLRGVAAFVFGADDLALPEKVMASFSVEIYRPQT